MLSASRTLSRPSNVAAMPRRSEITVLLVDDDPMMLAVLKEVLTREGYRVIHAPTPAVALELAATRVFTMLITDLQMPDMNGFVLATHLAKNRVALPVLILSGSDVGDAFRGEVAERHWNFISKPVGHDQLLRIVDGECLGSHLRRMA